jgi:hypothetical protein
MKVFIKKVAGLWLQDNLDHIFFNFHKTSP